MDFLYGIVRRLQNVVLVLSAVGLGFVAPGIGTQLGPLVTPLVVFLVYSSFRDTSPKPSMIRSYWGLLVLSLGLTYILLPVFGIRLVDTFLSGGTRIGFIISLAVPTTTGSAIVWTRLSDGEVQFSTVASVASLLVAPVCTPILLGYLLAGTADAPTVSILSDLIFILLAGLVLHRLIPPKTISNQTVNRATTTAILLLIYTSVSGSNASGITLWWLVQVLSVSMLLLMIGILLVAGITYWLKLSTSTALSLFFVGNLKNLGIALVIAVSYTESSVITTIVCYYVFQQIIAALIADLRQPFDQYTQEI